VSVVGWAVSEQVVVDGEWLNARLADVNVVPVDVRQPFFYAQGHIPGARSLPVFNLYSPRGGVPDSDVLARRMGELGITSRTQVVAYDDGASPAAARLYWILTLLGHERVSVLDGGVTRWGRRGYRVETAAQAVEPVEYSLGAPDESVRATMQDVLAAIETGSGAIVDTRSPAEYLGLQQTAAENGHMPGAINVDWAGTLDQSPDGTVGLLSDRELENLFVPAGASRDGPVIVYCQSGSRSSHAFMTLRKLGYTRVQNYDAGWQEWGNSPGAPVES